MEGSNLMVETLQVNNEKGSKEGVLVELTHKNTEVCNGVELTCFVKGEKVRTSSVCEEKETEAIPTNTKQCPCKEFTDLDCTKWYHEGVDFVLEHGIMKGVGEKRFNPNGKITRAQMVTTLYRMANTLEVKGENHFTDVKADKWYTDGIVWVSEVGITEDITETTFGSGRVMTREQMVTMQS